MAREYFHSYHSYLEAMKSLNDAECGRLYRACLTYSITGIAPELRGNERFIFDSMKGQIDRDIENYAIKCEQNRDNVLRRYTNAYERKRTYTKPTKEKEKEKEKEKDISPSISPLDDISENARKAFACFMEMRVKMKKPMTGEAVRLAVNKLKGMATDEATQIAIINQSIERCWLSFFPLKDEQKKPVKRAHNHSTRNYTPEELSAIGRDLLEDV